MSLVADPTTGVPSKQVVSYIAVERGELEAELTSAEEASTQADLVVAQAQEAIANAQADQVAKAAAVEEAKSLVGEFDSLTPAEAGVDAGTVGDGSDAETAVEDATEPAEEPQF